MSPAFGRLARFIGVAAVAMLAFGPSALASHYRLPAAGLVTPQETAALGKAGVHTTLGLLQAVDQGADRNALHQKTAIPKDRLWALARQCDLLRVKGIGPTMVRLLQAAEVADIQALASQNPLALASALKMANLRDRISQVVPGSEILTEWIAQARGLPRVLQAAP